MDTKELTLRQTIVVGFCFGQMFLWEDLYPDITLQFTVVR